MQRIGRGLAVAWLLILATVYVFPDIAYERRTFTVFSDEQSADQLIRGTLFEQGWRVKRIDTFSVNEPRGRIYEIERPRLPLR
jgi:hypothetical protein